MSKPLQKPPPPISTEIVHFVADARLLSVLGEQLISSEKVGILELVKNAYDAGATVCAVTIEAVPGLEGEREISEYSQLPGPIIEVRDDGCGMTREDLEHGWLRPATSRRARAKEVLHRERAAAQTRGSGQTFEALVSALRRAHGGRIPLGEKGIGRLATHRLGRWLWLRTKTADDPLEWELRINWDDFDALGDKPRDLAEVDVHLRHQSPTTAYGARESGTVICCYGGRQGYAWTQDLLVDVGRSIAALRSPTRGPEAFQPRFASPHVAQESLASPLDGVPAPFELLAAVDEVGVADIELHFTPPEHLEPAIAAETLTYRVDLRDRNLKAWTGRPRRTPECGPFFLHVRAWIRMKEWLGPDLKSVTQYLDTFGGITVYRDGLSTLPAQQVSRVDWLGLSLSQIKKTSNISYYQILGELEIEQKSSFGVLQDRTSREGMIETQAYRDLALLTRTTVHELQFLMQSVRKRWDRARRPRRNPATIAAHTRTLSAVAAAVADSYDFRKDPWSLKRILGVKNGASERLQAAGEAVAGIPEEIRLLEAEREGLLEVAGFGLAVAVAVHELGSLASAVVADARKIKVDTGDGVHREAARNIRERAEALLTEVRRLAPLRVTRTEPRRAFSVRAALQAAANAFTRTASAARIQIEVDGGDFKVAARFGAIAQVFANLLDNAMYWVRAKGEEQGLISISVMTSTRRVRVADSGPGISDKMLPHLFEPFFSERSPPSGLGLYICRYYLRDCGATIRLARGGERAPLSGAQFIIDFSKTPGETELSR